MSDADEKHLEFTHESQEPPAEDVAPITAVGSHDGSSSGGKEKGATETSPSITHTSAMHSSQASSSTLRSWLPVNVGAGILRDIRARAPWYWSDWTDAWNYRVLPATALILFAK